MTKDFKLSMKAEIEQVTNGFIIHILEGHKRYVAKDLEEVKEILRKEIK